MLHLISYELMRHNQRGFMRIEVQERGKYFSLIIKSSLFEGIFIDAKGINCASLETVHAKKYL